MNFTRFPFGLLEYLAASVAVGGICLLAGHWLAGALLARLGSVHALLCAL